MANEVKSEAEPGLAALVGGIVSDAQKLIEQQFTLLRREIEGEIRQAKTAAISLAVGAGLSVAGGMFVLLTVAHLVHTSTGLPLWGCYALVGGLLVGAGAALLYYGSREAADVHLITPPQTTEALKENLAWLKRQTTSEQT